MRASPICLTTLPPCSSARPRTAVGLRSVRERRGGLAANDCRGLANEILVLEGVHHEQREIYAPREVALEDRVAHVAAPHGQALTLALFKVAPSHDGPPACRSKTPAGTPPPGRRGPRRERVAQAE